MCKYPQIEVELVGQDGNAFSVLGRVTQAMQRGRIPKEEIEKFTKEATSGDYNELLNTCMEWVNCDPSEDEDEDDDADDDDDEDGYDHLQV